CFPRRDVEEQRVELIYTVYEPDPFAVALTQLSLLGIEVAAVIPALRRHLCHAVHTVCEVVPEFLERARLGIAAADADDGHIQCTANIRLRLMRRLLGDDREAPPASSSFYGSLGKHGFDRYCR